MATSEPVIYLKKLAGKFEKVKGIRIFGVDKEENPVSIVVDEKGHVQIDILSSPLGADGVLDAIKTQTDKLTFEATKLLVKSTRDWTITETLSINVTKGDWLSTLPVTKGDWLSAIPNPTALVDDTIKGLLRSIGDAGATPANTTGETMLKRLADLETFLDELTDALASIGTDELRIKPIGY